MRIRWVAAWTIVGVLAVSAGMTALDAAADAGSVYVPDIVADYIDRLVMIGTMFVAAAIVLRINQLAARTGQLEGWVERAAEEGRAWRAQSRRIVDDLSEAVAAQFASWGLTPAEADVAGLLIKGASLRDIAGLRQSSEATIRQQAQAVYRKSGLCNRAELAGYFLEDLFAVSELAGNGVKVQAAPVQPRDGRLPSARRPDLYP